MSDRNIFSGNTGLSVLDPPNLSAPPTPITSTWLATRDSRQLSRRVDSSITHEHYRALLTQTALNNIAALSTLEARLCEVAPYGEARYKAIVDSYTLSAAKKIVRW